MRQLFAKVESFRCHFERNSDITSEVPDLADLVHQSHQANRDA